jgi:hypothetical protein
MTPEAFGVALIFGFGFFGRLLPPPPVGEDCLPLRTPAEGGEGYKPGPLFALRL